MPRSVMFLLGALWRFTAAKLGPSSVFIVVVATVFTVAYLSFRLFGAINKTALHIVKRRRMGVCSVFLASCLFHGTLHET